MRRKDKEITEPAAIRDILQRAEACHIAMIDGDEPYVVPVNFAAGDGCLYFHSAPEGRKAEVLRRNPRVCFEAFTDAGLKAESGKTCEWGFRYRSVVGYGRAEFVDDPAEKAGILGLIVAKYAKGREYQPGFPPEVLARTAIVRIAIESLSGKISGF